MPSRSKKRTGFTSQPTTTITDAMTMFTEPFMQRAFLAALFLAPLCALLGVFVTARRMAFFSDTVAHAALAGVGIGFWLGLSNPTWPLIVVSLLIAAAILWLRSEERRVGKECRSRLSP